MTILKTMKNPILTRSHDNHFVFLERIKKVFSERDCVSKLPVSQAKENLENEQPRLAAVLMPIIECEDQIYLLFTRRTETVADHRGQVSFPGGSWEPGDINLVNTALRETWEELGITASKIEVLGCLEPRRLVSGFLVTPVLGLVRCPIELKAYLPEVARVFKIPIDWLADPKNRYLQELEYNGMNFQVTYYKSYLGEVLWGATASMTVEFLDLVGKIN
jgi:8-oxo-dGTP pyrophosphatase MutT (NUDIX family)